MKIFIDCGASDGRVSEEFLNQGHKDFVFHLFEPYYLHWPALESFKSKYPDVVIHIHHEAVWVINTVRKFFCIANEEANHIMKHKSEWEVLDRRHTDCINFHEWTLSNVNPTDYAILKMDIEGAEFRVLPKMMVKNSLLRYKELWIEFHQRFSEKYEKPHQRIRDYLSQHPEIKLEERY